jgi:hypothetical protein
MANNIELGSSNPTNYFIGSSQVSSIYQGTSLIWQHTIPHTSVSISVNGNMSGATFSASIAINTPITIYYHFNTYDPSIDHEITSSSVVMELNQISVTISQNTDHTTPGWVIDSISPTSYELYDYIISGSQIEE